MQKIYHEPRRATRPNTTALKRQLLKDFREWENKECQRLSNLFRALHAVLSLVTDPRKAAVVQREAENLEQLIDILSGCDDKAKFALWKGVPHV